MTATGVCEQYTHQYSTYRVAPHDHTSSREHAWLKSWSAQDLHIFACLECLSPTGHVSVLAARDTDYTHRFSLTRLICFSYLSDGLTSTHKIFDPRPIFTLRCSTAEWRINTNPVSRSVKAIETETIEPEDLEPRRIEIDRNLGKDPYQIQERLTRNNSQNPIAEDNEEFIKVGAEMSYISHINEVSIKKVVKQESCLLAETSSRRSHFCHLKDTGDEQIVKKALQSIREHWQHGHVSEDGWRSGSCSVAGTDHHRARTQTIPQNPRAHDPQAKGEGERAVQEVKLSYVP